VGLAEQRRHVIRAELARHVVVPVLLRLLPGTGQLAQALGGG